MILLVVALILMSKAWSLTLQASRRGYEAIATCKRPSAGAGAGAGSGAATKVRTTTGATISARFFGTTKKKNHYHATHAAAAHYSSSTALHLNRVFCEAAEVSFSEDTGESMLLHLAQGDYRNDHIRNILKLEIGDTIKAGVLDVGSTDLGSVADISDEGIVISLGRKEALLPNDRPAVDLLLAVPRPLRLERILSVISCIGVGKLVLIGAAKVQNDYFGSHLFRRPDEMKKCLIEGLSQAACDCMLPEVLVRKNFRKFISDELDHLFPSDEYHRVIAHPPSESIPINPKRMIELHRSDEQIKKKKKKKILLAVGPEGGWEDVEVLRFVSEGFALVSLGPRILRTDMAVPVLLGLAHDCLNDENTR